MIKGILMIGIAMLMLASPAAAFDIVRGNAYEDCVGYTVSFCRENPEYIPCSISYMPTFKKSHMVAVKIIDSETLHVVDNSLNASYTLSNWQLSGEYYHFWIDEPVLRNWGIGRVKDNRWVVT